MVKVMLNLPTYLDLCGQKVRLKPGVNDVDPKVWAVVQDHPLTQHYISARAIEVEVPARGRRGGDQKSEES